MSKNDLALQNDLGLINERKKWLKNNTAVVIAPSLLIHMSETHLWKLKLSRPPPSPLPHPVPVIIQQPTATQYPPPRLCTSRSHLCFARLSSQFQCFPFRHQFLLYSVLRFHPQLVSVASFIFKFFIASSIFALPHLACSVKICLLHTKHALVAFVTLSLW